MSPQDPIDENAPLLSPAWRSDDAVSLESSRSGKTRTSLVLRIAAAMCSFVVLGLFTSSIGVMLRPISIRYTLSDLHVSFIFVVGPIGYVLAAQANSFIHSRFGQRGVAAIGPIFHILAAGIIAAHPPFSFVLVAFALVAIGNGFIDGSWCAWAGSMDNANLISGFLHGAFSSGAAAGPFLAGSMMARGRPWFEWYYVLLAASIFEFFVLLFAFRHEDASAYHEDKTFDSSNTKVDPKIIFKYRATWMSAAYFLADVGTETAISGWIVSFMERARHSTPYFASFASTGFWAGMAIGRLALGNVTDKIGVGKATTGYLLLAILFEVLFVVIPVPPVSIVMVTLVGFFTGPLFPSGIVVLTRLLPNELHIAAVSFVASVGQVGAALMPFGIGAVIDAMSIELFQYALVVLSILTVILWVAFSRLRPSAPASGDSSQQ